MSKSLTPWFPPEVAPVHEGVYEKDFGVGPQEYQLWDGSRWHYGRNTPDETALYAADSSRFSTQPLPRPWRGLAKKPASKVTPLTQKKGAKP